MSHKEIHYAWWIVVCCSALMLGSTGIIYDCSGIFLSPVSKEFGIGISDTAFYLTISVLTRVFVLPFIGNIISKLNLQILLCVTLALQCITFGAMSTFTSVYHYYAAGAVLGVTGSITLYMAIPLIINHWFRDRAGFAIGMIMTFSGVGSVVFQPIGAELIDSVGWRQTYVILAVFAAIIVLPLFIFVFRGKPSDIGLEAYGAEKLAGDNLQMTQNQTFDGMTAKEALKSPIFYIVLIASVCISYIASMNYHIASFAVSTGLAVGASGFVSASTSFGLIIGKPVLGYLNDKFGIITATFVYAILGVLGLGLLLSSYTNYTFLFIGTFVFGVSMSLITVEVLLIVKEVFGLKEYSTIYSYVMTVSSLAMAIGTFLNGKIFDASGSYITVFYIMIALNIVLAGSIRMIGRKQLVIAQ